MSSLLEGIAMIFGVLLLVVFAAGALLSAILAIALVCVTIVITSPFWMIVALIRPQVVKGVTDAALR